MVYALEKMMLNRVIACVVFIFLRAGEGNVSCYDGIRKRRGMYIFYGCYVHIFGIGF